jgi:ATP-dependent protease Clp ATPase subunit
MRDSRDDIKKIIEWHMICLQEGKSQFPCNFVPLVVGPSGSGKTYSITKTIAEWALYDDKGAKEDIPFIYIDSTQLTAEGWDGVSISQALYDGCQGDIDLLNYAIIYIDEIDKLGYSGGSVSDKHNKNIQSNLLSWLDPGTDKSLQVRVNNEKRSIPVSVAQATWIFSGAFEPLFQDKTLQSKSIGFNADPVSVDTTNYDQKMHWNDIKKAGLMPELVNRMNVLIQTKEYTDKELKGILESSYDKKFIESILGVKVPTSKLIGDVKGHKAGARGINKALYQKALERYKLRE